MCSHGSHQTKRSYRVCYRLPHNVQSFHELDICGICARCGNSIRNMEGTTTSAKMLDFLFLVGKLKHVKRTGWLLRNVPDPECVAGHMHRMAVITFLLDSSQSSLDRDKCMQLALIHDLAECIVGDLTPHCGVDPEEKHKREDEAMKELCNLAGAAGAELYSLYKEYEAKSTSEAKFVKELDNLDMILEAFSYEKAENQPGHLQEFFDSTEGKFAHPLILSIVKELHKRRSEFSEGQNKRENK
ncbi:5'-deoxynucleotidase HDDC2 [Frankliniella fusca]|uniref:5'-deoxynucleotidase HDDC2 n=1 Tax=Frankliniella fusca TaxID=407009 RepID=A0AAE1I094_9NEOP|nr:5'-deoxynucleotidase HDDC2 [Frankliniella fusca]